MLNKRINSKIIIVLVAAVLVFAALVFYHKSLTKFLHVKKPGEKSAETLKPAKLHPLPRVVVNFSGKIVGIEGNLLRVDSFDLSKDFQPGRPHPKIMRKVTVTPDTKIVDVLNNKILSLKDLKVGDEIAVYANTNVRKENDVTAFRIHFLSHLPLSKSQF